MPFVPSMPINTPVVCSSHVFDNHHLAYSPRPCFISEFTITLVLNDVHEAGALLECP